MKFLEKVLERIVIIAYLVIVEPAYIMNFTKKNCK
jgi:hypothetical protein